MCNRKSNKVNRVWTVLALLMPIVGCQTNDVCPPKFGCNPNELTPNFGDPAYLSLPGEPCIDDCGPVNCEHSPLAIQDYASIDYENLSLNQCTYTVCNTIHATFLAIFRLSSVLIVN